MELPSEPQSWPKGVARQERLRGMRLAAKLHLFQIPICLAYGFFMALKYGNLMQFFGSFWIPAASIGTTQLIYLIPAAVIEVARGRRARAMGIARCALITFLLNIALVLLFIFLLCSQLGR